MQDIGLSELAGFMTDYWKFIRDNFSGSDSEKVVSDAKELGKKYNVEINSLPANLINAFLAYLDSDVYEKSGKYPAKRWLNE